MNKQDKKFILAVVIMQKGFLLLESLLAIFIISVVAVSSLSVTNTFLASAKVSNNLLAENDLRLFIHKSLEGDQCFQNLDSSLLSDSTTEANTKIVELLKVGSIELRTDDPNNEFKNSFIIKKMVLEDDPTEPDQKKMKVYFERKGLKHLSTRDNKACDLNNIEGCYSYTCDVIYTSTPDACSAIDCFAPDSLNPHLLAHNDFDSKMSDLENRLQSELNTMKEDILAALSSMGALTTIDPVDPVNPPVCRETLIISATKNYCPTSTELSMSDSSIYSLYSTRCTSYCSSKPGTGNYLGGGSHGGCSGCLQCKICTCTDGYTNDCP